MDGVDPKDTDTAERNTLLDTSLERAPAIPGLDMRQQRDAVHARLFGRASGEPEGGRPEGPAGQHIGRYLVLGTLGQGGMGKVLLAHDETLGRDVALKVLHEARERHGQRLLREAQALARLSHPNIVRVYDVDEIDGRLCMAMELVQGTPLDRWQVDPHPWREVLDVYRQAGRGLAAAHAQGLVHRDFKPANCILDAQGVVKVLDFGLARGVGAEPEASVAEAERTHLGDSQGPQASQSAGSSSSGSQSAGSSGSNLGEDALRASRSQRMLEQALTRTGTMLGTLAYMAPEQLLGKPADPRSDQFAFCVSLYDAVFGKRPYGGSTAMALLYSIQSQRIDPPPARPGLPPVPKWLVDVLRRGLSVAGHQRYADMGALLAELDRGLARQRRVRVAALGTVLAASLAGVLGMIGASRGERPCESLREQPMPAWTDDDRQAVGAAIEAASLPEGTRVRERVEERLDAYAQAWSEARGEACEATWVRHEAGEQALARRMACLDERAVTVRAVVDQLARADARTAAFAPAAVDGLPSLAPCADVDALLRGPAPVPSERAEEAAAIRELVARSWAAGATGDDSRGMEAADRAVEAAAALADAPVLQLEALHNRGHLLRVARRWDQARADLEAALALAERIEDDARAIDVLIELLLLAEESDESAVAAAWLAAAAGKLERFAAEPRRAAQREWLAGVVAFSAGRVDEASAAAARAVASYDALAATPERADAERFEAVMLLGDASRKRGDMGAAEAAFARAYALADESGQLLLVARALHKQAHLHYVQGRHAAAKPLIERSLALRDAFFGPLSTASIRARLMLAMILQHEGSMPQAIEQATLAQQSFDDRVPPQLRAEVLELLGGLLRAQQRCRDAIDRYREARSILQTVPVPNRVDLAMLDGNIADCLVVERDFDAARELYDGVLRVLEVETAPDDPRRAYPLLGRGQLLLELGEREAAIASLRAAQRLEAALVQDPGLHAELRWQLGRALGPGDGEGVALVRAAREVFVGARQTIRIAETDAWLAGTTSHDNDTEPQRQATKQ